MTIEVRSEWPLFVDGHQYWLDCFLPDYLVAIEIDGPFHSRRKDEERDARLNSIGVFMLRITKSGMAPTDSVISERISASLALAEATLDERKALWKGRE
jgi:very-short-patch-repair endonuclease